MTTIQQRLNAVADQLEKAMADCAPLVAELRRTSEVEESDLFRIRLEVVLVVSDLRDVNEKLMTVIERLT